MRANDLELPEVGLRRGWGQDREGEVERIDRVATNGDVVTDENGNPLAIFKLRLGRERKDERVHVIGPGRVAGRLFAVGAISGAIVSRWFVTTTVSRRGDAEGFAKAHHREGPGIGGLRLVAEDREFPTEELRVRIVAITEFIAEPDGHAGLSIHSFGSVRRHGLADVRRQVAATADEHDDAKDARGTYRRFTQKYVVSAERGGSGSHVSPLSQLKG